MTRRTIVKRKRWPPPKAKLAALIEEATIDAYGESEQRVGFYTLLDERLKTPFDTDILGVTVTVERIDMTDDEQIVAICRRGRSRQRIPVLDLPLPNPRPAGAEWIEAYRSWSAGA
ncbi:MAG TPA: calcium-binding protein [Gemmatimonadaceae bacterium]